VTGGKGIEEMQSTAQLDCIGGTTITR